MTDSDVELLMLAMCEKIKGRIVNLFGIKNLDEHVNVAALKILTRIRSGVVDFTKNESQIDSYLIKTGIGAIRDYLRDQLPGGRSFFESNLKWNCPECGFSTHKAYASMNGFRGKCKCGIKIEYVNENPKMFAFESLMDLSAEVELYTNNSSGGSKQTNSLRKYDLLYDPDIDGTDLHLDVHSIVSALPDRYRITIEMLMDGYSQQEISKYFKVAESTITGYKHQAYRMLKFRLRSVDECVLVKAA